MKNLLSPDFVKKCATPLVCLFCLLLANAHAAPEATPEEKINIKEGFAIERLYSVPAETEGSWVAMTLEKKGRLIVSDQYGSLYRVTVPAIGKKGEVAVEKIDLDIGKAQGLLYAHGAIYLTINDKAHGGRGLYRVKDTDGDDQYDEVKLLKKFEEMGGEHGPHAVVANPDGKSIYVVVGNQTPLPPYDACRVPEVWQEDQLIPRIYGRGFMKGQLAPRGWIAKTDPEGKTWEIQATGFRNEYDAAFNLDGELFTYDADMEWDMNTPWYRPTRINHVISGADYGWRNGSGKWPAYYEDSFGAAVNIGPGSPTGVSFGYGAKFPAKYQKAFYAMDWSYGKLYAVHLEPDGASFKGVAEEFISAQPLPLTDLAVNPEDGAMYFTVGGRRVQSGLYRVTYKGDETTAQVTEGDAEGKEAREQRRALEALHLSPDAGKLGEIWKALESDDRAIRHAARVALEKLPVEKWKAGALAAKTPNAAISSLIALARQGGEGDRGDVLEALNEIDYGKLTRYQKLGLVRAYALAFIRLGSATAEEKASVAKTLEAHFPAKTAAENIELSQLFAYLDHAAATPKTVALLESAPSQEEQIAYAKNLRVVKSGWTPELRTKYLKWFVRAQTMRGGASFAKFVESIKNDAVANLPEDAKKALQPVINEKAKATGPQFVVKPREFVKAWTMKDLEGLLASGLEGGRDYANGRNLFGAAACFACHRFDGEGGAIGPDLTSVAGQYSPRDLLEQIIDPNKEISDQYGAMVFKKKDGSTVVGRIMNLSGDQYKIMSDMLDPNAITSVKVGEIVSIDPSPASMMPPGLMNNLEDTDILDLLAYLLSGGDAENPLFQ